jgi:hypothetical protein
MEKQIPIIVGLILISFIGKAQFEGPDGERIKPYFDSTLTEKWSNWKIDEYSDFGGTWTTLDSSRSRNQLIEKSMSTITEHRTWTMSKDSICFFSYLTDWTKQKELKSEPQPCWKNDENQ